MADKKKDKKEKSAKDGSKYIELHPTIDYDLSRRFNPKKAMREWLESRLEDDE